MRRMFLGVLLVSASAGCAEVAARGLAHGVAPADLLDVLINGVFTAPAYKTYCAAIAKQQYVPAGFRLSLMLKDLRLALAAADAVGVPRPLADVVHDALLEAVAQRGGDRDTAALAEAAMRRIGAAGEARKRAS